MPALVVVAAGRPGGLGRGSGAWRTIRSNKKVGANRSAAYWRKVAAGYGFFLYWLDSRGELDPNEPIAKRVTRERVTAYLEYLKQRNRGHTIHNRIQELGMTHCAILVPEHDWTWLGRAAGRPCAPRQLAPGTSFPACALWAN